MSDSTDLSIGRVQPVGGTAPVQPVRTDGQVGTIRDRSTAPHDPKVAAVTDGNLGRAYAQFVVNQDTNDVVIRIHDAATDRVIAEYPSRQVEEMASFMKQYEETLARLRAALRTPGSTH